MSYLALCALCSDFALGMSVTVERCKVLWLALAASVACADEGTWNHATPLLALQPLQLATTALRIGISLVYQSLRSFEIHSLPKLLSVVKLQGSDSSTSTCTHSDVDGKCPDRVSRYVSQSC